MLAFPTIESLAHATLRDVLAVWQGLGYYRRARYLHEIAKIVVEQFCNNIPQDPAILQMFPGIGANTAASICAFAFNMPTVFIETNIRTVFIHHFFSDKTAVTDKELLPLIQTTVDRDNPREWYYALMDYGVFLKKTGVNPSRKSKHHAIQSRFEGSDRQIRGMILRFLTSNSAMTVTEIVLASSKEPERVQNILNQLCHEGFIKNEAEEPVLENLDMEEPLG